MRTTDTPRLASGRFIYGTGANANDGNTFNALQVIDGGTALLGTMPGGVFTPGGSSLADTNNTIRVVNGVRQ